MTNCVATPLSKMTEKCYIHGMPRSSTHKNILNYNYCAATLLIISSHEEFFMGSILTHSDDKESPKYALRYLRHCSSLHPSLDCQ
ncbi:unnamed protein product [Schistosoma haematobium]|nr:unnamed protein product [Schistosoma haematobium]